MDHGGSTPPARAQAPIVHGLGSVVLSHGNGVRLSVGVLRAGVAPCRRRISWVPSRSGSQHSLTGSPFHAPVFYR
jgi:hypothetical protein